MSTSELFLDPDEIEEFIRETKKHPQWFYGYEGQELGICPYITFYVYHPDEDFTPIAKEFLLVWKRFQELMDLPFKKIFKNKTEVWLNANDKRLPTDLMAEAEQASKRGFEDFYLMATDMDSPDESPRWSYAASITSNHYQRYSFLKLGFRYKWYAAGNQNIWKQFIRECVTSLQPEHCYMGYEVGNGGLSVMTGYEANVLERICADYFYGMDIDHPWNMTYHGHGQDYFDPSRLGAGIRTPTWCFMLSPFWQRKLGKDEQQIRAELDDPRIRITPVPYAANALNPEGANGLWIELGDLNLYPVEDGVPDLLVKANRLIRPIRCDELSLSTLASWADDPNPRFEYEDSIRWMRRFDEDSDWPNAQIRHGGNPLAPDRIPSGQPCPQTGWWYTPAQNHSRRYFKAGELMPVVEGSSYGETYWIWDPKQDAPKL
ncbi:type VI immunity family protein [Comamonas sp. NoAH]|uniref:type VI immunity family protein n=1 Tax=Comamonas halotolerans TaxID=3041496 RepID=UPI0024E13607|nr:type VI immunity family protein [Comamonas sp. NoAH]